MFRKTKVYPKDELVCNQYMMFKIYIYYHGNISTIILHKNEGSNFFLIDYVSIEDMHIYFYDDTDQNVFSFLLIHVPH